MSSGDKVRLHICVERELYDRLYARHRDTGEKMVAILKRALEREIGGNRPARDLAQKPFCDVSNPPFKPDGGFDEKAAAGDFDRGPAVVPEPVEAA